MHFFEVGPANTLDRIIDRVDRSLLARFNRLSQCFLDTFLHSGKPNGRVLTDPMTFYRAVTLP